MSEKLSVRTLASSIGLIFLFGAAAYGGLELISYENLSDRVATELSRADASGFRIDSSVISALSSWTNLTGVSGWARGALVTVIKAATPEDRLALERASADAAEPSPTWATGWLQLAEVRLANGRPMESVLAAFRMSQLTASHEGYMMAARAIFGLKHWKNLPEPDRSTVIRDLQATAAAEHSMNTQYRTLLAAKPAADREEIRAALIASGLTRKDLLEAFGI